MSRNQMVWTLAFSGLLLGVSVHFLIEDIKTAAAIIVAASALDVFWDVVLVKFFKKIGWKE